MEKSGVVNFEPNVPVQVALKFPEGRSVESRFGFRTMFTLTDSRVMFFDTDVAGKINMLELAPGESFVICKRWSGQKGQPVRWDVWRAGERYQEPEPECPEFPSELENLLRESIQQFQQRKQGRRAATLEVPIIGATSKPQPLRSASPAPAPKLEPKREVSPIRIGWPEALVSQANALTDAYAACLSHANQYGTQVKPEDVRTLLVTAYINISKNGVSHAA